MAAVHFDVVALVASAGGLSALDHVLRQLPDDFSAALVIVQHLGGTGSRLVEILGRRSPLPVQWIADHDLLEPGRVYICPPQQLLEVTPDAECSVRPMEPDHRLRPIDFFLAGGTVLVQSPESAEHPVMPSAVIGAGVADMVLPLAELGRCIVDVVAKGAPPPRSLS